MRNNIDSSIDKIHQDNSNPLYFLSNAAILDQLYEGGTIYYTFGHRCKGSEEFSYVDFKALFC